MLPAVVGLMGLGWLAPTYAAANAIYLSQASAPARPTAYTLGAGDQVRVDVFDAPEYTGEYQVLSDGTISLPMVGVVQISGLTLEGAASTLSARLSPILRRPIVTMQLLNARPVNFAIAGQINRPGAYTLDTDAVDAPTVTNAIQLAGGITPKANIRDIQVIRVDPLTRQPQQVFVANLWELVRQGDLQQDMVLQDGDRVIIPEAANLENEELTELASANISPEVMTVNVVGEVSSPGSIALPPNTPLNQAILAAGGFSRQARKKRVELLRLNPNGSVTQQEIEVDLAADASNSVNPLLRPNDTIVVEPSTFSRVTRRIGDVVAPIGGIFSLFRIFGL